MQDLSAPDPLAKYLTSTTYDGECCGTMNEYNDILLKARTNESWVLIELIVKKLRKRASLNISVCR
jgi:hypothetical protein